MESDKTIKNLLEELKTVDGSKNKTPVNENNDDVDAAVEVAKSLSVNNGMAYPLAAQSAARELNVDFDSVYQSLKRTMNVPSSSEYRGIRDISGAVAEANDLVRQGMDYQLAAQAAARDFNVDFDSVYRGLQRDRNVDSYNVENRDRDSVINEVNFKEFSMTTLKKLKEECNREIKRRRSKT